MLPLNYQKNKVFSEETKTYRIFNDSSFSFMLAEATHETEAGFIEHCTSCRKQNSISPVPLNIRTCNLISYNQDLMDGKLSDYWAQELIGSDLLREELKNLPPPKIPNWIAVFDSQKKYRYIVTEKYPHDIFVKNLISDKNFHAVLPELRSETIPIFHTSNDKEHKSVLSLFETGFPGDYVSEADYLQKAPLHFINSSMSWFESEDIYEVFQKLSPPSIVVTGSGNEFPEKLDDLKSKASKNFDTIIVGSFSSNGFVSDYSISGKKCILWLLQVRVLLLPAIMGNIKSLVGPVELRH